MCESMNWAQLPLAGGIYDQHPLLMEEFGILFTLKNERERRQAAEQEEKSRRPTKGGGSRKGRRR